MYNSAEGKTLIDNPLRASVESVLHYLGLHLDFCDLADGLPDATTMAAYRGVVIWLESERVRGAEAYWSWLDEQLAAGRRVVLLNSAGPRFEAVTGRRVPLDRINSVLHRMGLRTGVNFSSMPLDIELVHRDSQMVEFERRLTHELTRFYEMRSIGPDNRVALRLRMRSTGSQADAVVLTPQGGYAGEGYVRYRDPLSEKLQWRLNPFAFLAEALDVVDTPRLDCTTRFGNRIYYSHIDGDGIRNRSLVDSKKSAAELVHEQILQAYPDLPFTVSVITAEVDPEVFGSQGLLAMARRILAPPNVEAASHTFSHPLVWNRNLVSLERVTEYGEEITTAFSSGLAVLPWRIPGYEYDIGRETVESCRYIERVLLPPGKTCRLLLWSGNTLPDEETLALLDEAGMANMNGGDSRLDGEYPSYNYVAPLYRQVGERFQVHSSNSNENTYTNLWTGPFGGYQNAIQTFARTGAPRRILPVNIYYHFYSGEHEAAITALRLAYDWVTARRDGLFPIYGSQYPPIVHGFIGGQVERQGPGIWRLSRFGECRTVRFDGCTLYPDLAGSSGVIGYDHQLGSLYVSLDRVDTATIVLTDERPQLPYLERATAAVDEIAYDPDGGVRFRSGGLGRGVYHWRNLPPGRTYLAALRGSSTPIPVGTTDDEGRLEMVIPLSPSVEVRATPENPAGSGQ